MKHKKISKKEHSVGSVLVSEALIMSVFAVGLYTGNNNSVNNPNNQITAAAVGMEGVTGFATQCYSTDGKRLDTCPANGDNM